MLHYYLKLILLNAHDSKFTRELEIQKMYERDEIPLLNVYACRHASVHTRNQRLMYIFEIRVLSYCCWGGHFKSLKLQYGILFYSHINSQEEVAKEFGIPVQFQRFWLWAKRQNHTYRPNRPLTPQEEAQSVSVFLFAYVFALSSLF